jgi:hypothetical protein
VKVNKRIRYELIGRRKLTSGDVRELVFESIGLIDDAQMKLQLSICPNLIATIGILNQGTFHAAQMGKEREGKYHTLYGDFTPPATITLDDELPFCDSPLDLPEVPHTMTYYTSVHEVIHADDYVGGDQIIEATREHILEDHKDKLEVSMEIIRERSDDDCIRTDEELAGLWAIQYSDLLTHYRSYVVMRHHGFPRLDFIWNFMQNDIFPPSLLTMIERDKGTRYIFETIIERVGEYCLIDALMESINIGEKSADVYTV